MGRKKGRRRRSVCVVIINACLHYAHELAGSKEREKKAPKSHNTINSEANEGNYLL